MPRDANYDKAKQKAPQKRMGSGSFANLPKDAIVKDFAGPRYRDGITNSFASNIEELSGIQENQR